MPSSSVDIWIFSISLSPALNVSPISVLGYFPPSVFWSFLPFPRFRFRPLFCSFSSPLQPNCIGSLRGGSSMQSTNIRQQHIRGRQHRWIDSNSQGRRSRADVGAAAASADEADGATEAAWSDEAGVAAAASRVSTARGTQCTCTALEIRTMPPLVPSTITALVTAQVYSQHLSLHLH
jgi:hypothetical protein